MTTRLTFSPKAHTYAIDGRRAPGVTTVIRNSTDKPGLVGAAAREVAIWAANHRDDYESLGEREWIKQATGAYREVWNRARDNGTRLHLAALQMINGDPVEAVDRDTGEVWPDDAIRQATQLARFMDEWEVQPLIAERPVFNVTNWWAGTVDLVANLKDGRRWLIDYKTGASGIWPETSMQCAAYRHAEFVQMERDGELVDLPMPQVDEVGALWVRPDGYELGPVRADLIWYGYFQHMLPVSAWVGCRREESVYDPLPIP